MPPHREEIIGDCRLILGDCREVLPTIGQFDAIITSPPYNMGVSAGGGFASKFIRNHGHYAADGGYRKRGGGGKWTGGDLADGYGSHDDKMERAAYEEWQRAILMLCWECLTEDGAIFYNHKPRAQRCEVWLPLALNPGLPLRQIVIWARAGGINFAPTHYVPTHEWLMIFAKPEFRLRDKAASGVGDVWQISQESATEHPAPFPVELPLRVLETVSAGTVLDPFMGSASTALACIRRGRRFTGIEIEPRWFDLSRRRIEQAYRQGDLIRDVYEKPKQTALPLL
jgi:site-specific DNA-methyltransferase (adenine-specific)